MIPQPYDLPAFALLAVLLGTLIGWFASRAWSRGSAARREARANREAWKMSEAYYHHKHGTPRL